MTFQVMMISAPQEKIPDIVKQLVDFMKEIPIKGHSKPYGEKRQTSLATF